MTINDSISLTSALAYLEMSLSIFPLAARERPPKQFKWEKFQHTLPTQDQVKFWFDGSDNNIAIVTGAVSRLLALDIDGPLGKSYVDNVIQNRIRQDTRDAISDTLWVETGGGGFHLLVRYDPAEFQQDNRAASEIKNAVLWRGKDGHSEIRLKSNGGYVVAPPSVHPSGSHYRFIKGNVIAELSKDQILDLIRCFKQIGRIRTIDAQKEGASKDTVLLPATTELDDEQVMGIVVILKPYYLKGQRHEFVLYLSGWLRKEGIAIESVRKIIEGLAVDNDEELSDRLATLQDTYNKQNSDGIKGYQGLLEILQAQLGSMNLAHQILKELQDAFPQNAYHESYASAGPGVYDCEGSKSSTPGNKLPSASELAIGLVNKKEKEQQQENNSTPTIIVEQINGLCYTFDTANCALMFRNFKDIYGSSFADE